MGLMDPARKRPLPAYPETIGLVTSPRGAAVHDVLRTLRRRYPLARILFAGVPVEGPGAADGLVDGLAKVVFAGAEVVLLVRGGGSFEDLMPFNDRRLARTIAACPVPVVTGIGHEPDTSIADMVADVRASTPNGGRRGRGAGPERDRRSHPGARRRHGPCRGAPAGRAVACRWSAWRPCRCSASRRACSTARRWPWTICPIGSAGRCRRRLREDRHQTGPHRRGFGTHAARAALGAPREQWAPSAGSARLSGRALRRALRDSSLDGARGRPDARRRGDDRPLSRVGGRERGAPARSVASGHHRPRLRHGEGGGRPSSELGGRRRARGIASWWPSPTASWTAR